MVRALLCRTTHVGTAGELHAAARRMPDIERPGQKWQNVTHTLPEGKRALQRMIIWLMCRSLVLSDKPELSTQQARGAFILTRRFQQTPLSSASIFGSFRMMEHLLQVPEHSGFRLDGGSKVPRSGTASRWRWVPLGTSLPQHRGFWSRSGRSGTGVGCQNRYEVTGQYDPPGDWHCVPVAPRAFLTAILTGCRRVQRPPP